MYIVYIYILQTYTNTTRNLCSKTTKTCCLCPVQTISDLFLYKFEMSLCSGSLAESAWFTMASTLVSPCCPWGRYVWLLRVALEDVTGEPSRSSCRGYDSIQGRDMTVGGIQPCAKQVAGQWRTKIIKNQLHVLAKSNPARNLHLSTSDHTNDVISDESQSIG